MANINPAEVAKYQRWLILVILAQIVLLILSIVMVVGAEPETAQTTEVGPGSLLMLLFRLAVGIAGIVMLLFLMAALQRPMVSRILAAISQFIPLVGLIVLLVVNQRATKTLQAAGYHVGLMGAKPK